MLALLVAVCVTVTGTAGAQDADRNPNPQPGIVLAASVPAEGHEASTRGALIRRALVLELERHGLVAIPAAADAADEMRSERRFARAAEVGASFVLVAACRLSNTDFQIDFSWYDVRSRSRDVFIRKDVWMELSADSVVSEAVSEIVSEASDDFFLVESAPDEAEIPAPLVSEPPSASVPVEEHRSGISARASGGVMFPLARLSDYTSIGGSGGLDVLLGTERGGTYYEAGLRVGGTTFEAVGVLDSGRTVIVPVGAVIAAGTSAEGLRGLVEIGGGGAVLWLVPEYGAESQRLLPYAEAALAAELTVGSRVSLGLRAAAQALFGSDAQIVTLQPGMYVRTTL